MASAGIGRRVEGFHAVAAAVAAGRVERLFIEESRLRRDDYETLAAVARGRGVDVEVIDDVRTIAETSAPQGVVAEARAIPGVSLEAVAAVVDPSAVVVLDHLEEVRNVGAVARTALAAGVPAMVVPSRRAAPVSAAAFKAAAGALEHVAMATVSSTAKAVDQLRTLGRVVGIVGLDGGADRSIFGLDLLSEPVAIVIGAEGKGLSRLVADRCDGLYRIPMLGETESLNASVAAALALYEIGRVRGSL